MSKSIYILIISIALLFLSAGCRLKKGFEALDVYNYFAAKANFEKSLKKDQVAASYGLSLIYLRSDNPFSNIDSALYYVQSAATNYSLLKESTKEKYKTLKVDSLAILELRAQISKAHYLKAKSVHSVERYQAFIDQNSWSIHKDSAIFFRDQLAFNTAKANGDTQSYKSFLAQYPNSELYEDALSAYHLANYQEQTEGNKIIDYISFCKEFPENPYTSDAEDQIYAIYTKTGSLKAYQSFIEEFPTNRNISTAWRKMVDAYLQNDYSANNIQNFLRDFENYPFKEDLKNELLMADRIMLPIRERNKWGYIDNEGENYIRPSYESASLFYEGLAIVELEEKYGFVDKRGIVVIDAIFDDAFKMNEGHAVVEIQGKLGMINRSGEFVVPPNYEDLGNLTEGFAYFTKNELYGYFDAKGIERLKPQYTSAENFENGKAIVSRNNYYGLIDVFGTTTISFKYDRLKKFSKKTYAAQFDRKWGVITELGDSLLPFEYDYIGDLSCNRAIIEKDGTFNFIDSKGNIVLKTWLNIYPEFRQLATYQANYAKVKFNDGYNLIDTTGKKVFRQNKDDVKAYSNYIAVKRKEKWGYLSEKGAVVINYKFTSAESFSTNNAKAGGYPLVGIIDKKGNYIIEPYFERLTFINDTLMIAKSRGNYGVLNVTGDTIVPLTYKRMEQYDKNLIQVETNEAIYYYKLDENRFLKQTPN